MRVFIGIDPGKSGGYSVIREELDGSVTVESCIWDDEGFLRKMSEIETQARLLGWNVCCAVEKVGSMPGQGVKGVFSFGHSAGYIEGVLRALGIPYQLVPPRVWKKAFSLTNDKKLSIEVCKKLFPNVDLRATERCRTDSDGKAESLMLALYAKRTF